VLGARLSDANNDQEGLIAGGDLSLSGSSVLHGSVVYSGTARISNTSIPRGNARRGKVLDFPFIQHYFQHAATTWGRLSPNGTTTMQEATNGRVHLILIGTDPNLNVFALDARELARADLLSIQTPKDATVLINISGVEARMRSFGFSLLGADQQRVLFNFF